MNTGASFFPVTVKTSENVENLVAFILNDTKASHFVFGTHLEYSKN